MDDWDNWKEPAPEYEVCEVCDGSGRIYTEFNPENGEHIREVTYTEYLSLSPDVRNIEQCPHCNGDGYTPIPYRDYYTEQL